MTLKELVIPVGASIIAFIIAAVLGMWVSKQKPGTQEMMDISNAVGVGAMAFLIDRT
jgi:K(+)-stimulated pyrophosphate-energized sodium pump